MKLSDNAPTAMSRMNSSYTYFAPTKLALQALDPKYLPSYNLGKWYTVENKETYSYYIDKNGEYSKIPDATVVQLLPPDHKTARLVERDGARVVDNSFSALFIRNHVTTAKYHGSHSSKKFFEMFPTLEIQDEEIFPHGLTLDLQPRDMALLSAAAVPIPGAGYLADFRLVMESDPNNPSHVVPFAVFPSAWINHLGIETKDITWSKKPSLTRGELKTGYWYSLPAGRLGLFCGYTADNKYVFLERKNGYGKTLDDNAVATAVESRLSGHHTWQKISIKNINRSSYNSEIAKYSGDISRVLLLCKNELGETPTPDYN